MSINHNKFISRPGIVNKQGYLPDPTELVCIEVPKIFDQVLIKRCLIYGEGPDTDTTDEELRSNALNSPKRYLGCRDFSVKITSVDKTPLKKDPNYKKVIAGFIISFYMDYIDGAGVNQSELFEINRTEIIPKMYCPDSVAQISASFLPVQQALDLNPEIVKLEMVAECLDGKIATNSLSQEVIDLTLGFHLIVKCELIAQVLIPSYEYIPSPTLFEAEVEEAPSERFEKQPIPKFYPDLNLKPLFPECTDCADFDDKE